MKEILFTRILILHKDINPSNIVWNRATGEVKIIDFGISTELSRENLEIKNLDNLEGTIEGKFEN
ncbi:MAG: hypothetical protein B6I31_05455 [Desulfobacteraceae bacterium 4572_19]|nr:MAG: hypothetical protein B6I31_05455 [Desulfobacteraceae bacterium 4572_19]